MFDHPCVKLNWLRVGVQSVQPSWKMSGFTSCNKWQLRELRVFMFRPLLGHHMLFVRSMMDRAPNLKTVLLVEGLPCKECDAMAAPRPPVGGMFPRGKEEQETIAKQLRGNGDSASTQIIFRTTVSTVVF